MAVTELPLIWGHEIVSFQGQEYWVKKVNPANYVIVDVKTGSTYNLRRTARLEVVDRQLTPEERKTVGDLTYSEMVEKRHELPRVGAVITVPKGLSHKKWTYATTQLFVVLAQSSLDRVKIVELGGNNAGTTWTVTASLTQVETV